MILKEIHSNPFHFLIPPSSSSLNIQFQFFFLSNSIYILLIVISFVLDTFFIQFHPSIFYLFRILLCYFQGLPYCEKNHNDNKKG